MKRFIIKSLLIGLIVTLLFTNFKGVVLTFSSEITCGKIIKEGTVANNLWMYDYMFYIDGEPYEAIESMGNIKKVSIDSLKKIECIKVKYSPHFPSISKIVDERVLR